MKLQGEVLIAFNDIQDNYKRYAPKDEYKEADIYVAEKDRYEELRLKGFLAKGKKVEEKKKVEKEEDK